MNRAVVILVGTAVGAGESLDITQDAQRVCRETERRAAGVQRKT
jgi:hypothetical protein